MNADTETAYAALASSRAEIERIDRAIVVLVADRVLAGERAAATKRAAGLPLLDPEQEDRVVHRAAAFAREAGLPENEIRELSRLLIGLTRRRQVGDPMIVAIQGELGSFSHAAEELLLNGPDVLILPCTSFDEVFSGVESRRADCGVVPVHNAIVGPVGDNAERVRQSRFRVLAHTHYPVRLCLIARPGKTVYDIIRVASHAVALQQCRTFFASRPGCMAIPVGDTAGGVRDLVAGRLDADAVIASSDAAQRYGGVVLMEGLEDDPQNVTEFVLIAPASGRPNASRAGALRARGAA